MPRRQTQQKTGKTGRPETQPLRQPISCPLCGRLIPLNAKASRHHLVPRLKGGTHKGTVLLHQICHNAIHARFSEAEIAARLADMDKLRADPELAKFIAWVRPKPPAFHAPTHKRKRDAQR